MNEIIVVAVLFLAGIGIARLFLKSEYPMFTAASAFPFGLLVWFVAYIAVYFFPFSTPRPVPFTVVDVRIAFGVLCFITIALLMINFFRYRLKKQELLAYMLVFGILAGVYFYLKHFRVFVIVAEPYSMLDIETPLASLLSAGVPVFNKIIFSLSPLIGDDYVFATFPQYTAVSLILLMVYVMFGELRRHSDFARSFFFALLPVLILFSSYAGLWQIFYTNHHLVAATYVLLFAASCWLAIRKQSPAALFLGVVALLAFCLTRMEGLLCAIPFLCIFLSDPAIPPKYQRASVLAFCCGVAPWSLYLVRTLGLEGGRIGSGMQHLLILVLIIIAALGFQLNRWSIGQRFLRPLNVLAPAGVWLVFLVFTRFKSGHMLLNLHVNLLSLLHDTHGLWNNPINIDADQHGGWGNVWFFILSATIVIVVLRAPTQRVRVLEAFGLSGLAAMGLVIAIIYFTGPYYAGLTDSANRIFFHFTPLLLVWVITQIGTLQHGTIFTEDT